MPKVKNTVSFVFRAASYTIYCELVMLAPAGLTATLNEVNVPRLAITRVEHTALVALGTVYRSSFVAAAGASCPNTLYVIAILSSH
jgi:hypothetical protein